MPPRRNAPRTLNRREMQALVVYLQNAHGSHMTSPGWGPNWSNW